MNLADRQATAEAIYEDVIVNSDLDSELAARVADELGLDVERGSETWDDLESLVRDKLRNAIVNIVINARDTLAAADVDDDEPECFDGSLNSDAGSPAAPFPPFLKSQLDHRADTPREKHNR